LSDFVAEMSVIFGISPSNNPTIELGKLAKNYSKSGNKQTQCLLQLDSDSFFIDTQVCQWCSKNTSCSSEFKSLNSLKIVFEDSTSESGHKIISEYLLNKKYSTNGRIFTNNIHPFRPIFGDISKSLMISPLRVFTTTHPSLLKSHWSHIFYSPALTRTLSIFEAMILDSIIDETQMFKMVRQYPTCGEFSSWYVEKGQNSVQLENMKKIIRTTQDKLPLHHNVKTELGSNLTHDSNIEEFVQSLLLNVHQSHIHESKNAEIPIVVERETCILLVPKGFTEKVPWNSAVRIIRIIEIDGIQEVYVLHHENINGLGFKPEKALVKQYRNSDSSKISFFHYSPPINLPESILNSIKKYSLPYTLLHWKNPPSNSQLNQHNKILDWFRPGELFEAHFANICYRNTASTSGDEEQLDHFEKLDYFVNRFFSITAEEEIDNESKLDDFLQIYRQPHYRKMTPYQALYNICKLNESSVSEFLRQTESPSDKNPAINIETFTFKINLKTNKLQSSSNQQIVKIYREVENPETNNPKKNPFVASVGGKVDFSSRELRRICSALDYGNESLKNNNFENWRISKSEHSVGGIWISSGLLNKLNSDFSDAIVSKIRVYALNRLLCCALVEELAEISLLVGEPEIIRLHKFESIEYCIWNPPSTASELSPNFVYVGHNRKI
jgi:hypothetical protein